MNTFQRNKMITENPQAQSILYNLNVRLCSLTTLLSFILRGNSNFVNCGIKAFMVELHILVFWQPSSHAGA